MRPFNRALGITSLLLLLMASFSCAPIPDNAISYTIAKTVKNDSTRLTVLMEFRTDPSGTTKILYDDEAWGEQDLFNCILDVQLPNEDGTIEVKKDSGWIQIKHSKDLEKIQFQYSVQQDFEELGTASESYRPLIQEAYFHVFAHNLFMMPGHIGKRGEDVIHVNLNWKEFPESYTIHNSFGSNQQIQQLMEIPLSEFHNAIFVGGDFKVHHMKLKENDVYLASRGDWIPFRDTTVVRILKKTLSVQRDFWEDHSQKYFTVTMRPSKQERGSSLQGTALTNSFATSISNNTHTDITQLVYLFNHELQHNWIGHAIQNANEEEQYWFSEGFTEYYAIKNSAKNKIGGLDKGYFISMMNETIRNLYGSAVKEAPNSEINYDNYWSNRAYSKLPYHRGALFAFYLDLTIAETSKGVSSLDNVMHDLHKAAKDAGDKLTSDHFIKTVNPYLKKDLSSFFNTHIEKGKWIPLEQLFVDLELEHETSATIFDLGFQLNEDNTAVISVNKASKAYEQGLRKGDQIRSRSIYYGSITHPVELSVVKNEKEQAISFYAIKEVQIPQLKDSKKNRALLKW